MAKCESSFPSPDSQNFRHDWLAEEVESLFMLPLVRLKAIAAELHKQYADTDVQRCVLLSIKTGGCAEDCGYCSQSARYQTDLKAEPLLSPAKVLQSAQEAKASGATRFCLGAAWRQIPDDQRFQSILSMVKGVSDLGLEVCVTLGMATESQLKELKSAGLTAYNHNLDTSREHYPNIVTTRTFDDRLRTLAAARRAGVQVCTGGILGMGEGMRDRASLLTELANMNPHPESVPVNILVPIAGTPMADTPPLAFEDFLRTVAVARILMPQTRVRLSAGRNTLTNEQQRECFEVGANSIFMGEKLLTTPNVSRAKDEALFGSPTA